MLGSLYCLLWSAELYCLSYHMTFIDSVKILVMITLQYYYFCVHVLACEYSRLSFASATTCETRRKTSAIHLQKFLTDDVNLS